MAIHTHGNLDTYTPAHMSTALSRLSEGTVIVTVDVLIFSDLLRK